MPRLLVSNADNEFVGRLITRWPRTTRSRSAPWPSTRRTVAVEGPNIEPVTEPADETHALLTMPTDDEAADRAMSLIDAVDAHLVFIANEMDPQHRRVIEHIKSSGSPWTILHPVSMMDFSFAALPAQISMGGVVFGISGRTPIGFVSAADVMRVLTVIVEGEGHEGQEYVLSGPAAVDMPTVVKEVSAVLGQADRLHRSAGAGPQEPDGAIRPAGPRHDRAPGDEPYARVARRAGRHRDRHGPGTDRRGPESVSQWL